MFAHLEKTLVLGAAAITALLVAFAVQTWTSSDPRALSLAAAEADKIRIDRVLESLHRVNEHESMMLADLRARRVSLKCAAQSHLEILEDHSLRFQNKNWNPPTTDRVWFLAWSFVEMLKATSLNQDKCSEFERIEELEAELQVLAREAGQ